MLLQKTCRSIFFIYFCKKEYLEEANTMMTDEKLRQEQADEEMINQGFQHLLDS